MRYVLSALAALALTLGASSSVQAQVIISGEVTTYTEPTPTATEPAPASHYVGGEPVPTRYVHHSANIPGLYVPGLILLIGGYVVNATGAAWLIAEQVANDAAPEYDWYLYGLIPIIGPFMQFGVDGPQSEGVSLITGIAEVAGLIMTILGFALHDEWDEPVYVLDENDPRSPRLSFNLDTAPGGGAIATATLTHF